MKAHFEKSAGISLIIGSFLMVVTMVLHPVGGNFDHLVSIVTIGIFWQAIAILSIPFVVCGFWGLTGRLDTAPFFSRIGFSFMIFGLIAAMIAAALNGLVLMTFVQRYSEASQEMIESIKPIMIYSSLFNHALDYIYIASVIISTLFWSVAILKTKALSVWTGYFGIIMAGLAVLFLATGFYFLDLHGFRLFVFGAMAWTISVGFLLRKT